MEKKKPKNQETDLNVLQLKNTRTAQNEKKQAAPAPKSNPKRQASSLDIASFARVQPTGSVHNAAKKKSAPDRRAKTAAKAAARPVQTNTHNKQAAKSDGGLHVQSFSGPSWQKQGENPAASASLRSSRSASRKSSRKAAPGTNKTKAARKKPSAGSSTRTRSISGSSSAKKKKTRQTRPVSRPIKKHRPKRRIRTSFLLFLLVIGIFITGMSLRSFDHREKDTTVYTISPAVYAYEDELAKQAEYYGVSEYLPVLLCIMQVESAGQGEDVMQSSESLGLPVNSLSTEESIVQGVRFFSQLIDEMNERNLDLASVIQAYNFGQGFLAYVQKHGGKYSFNLASRFAKEQSDGITIPYLNPLAIEKNGGWRYAYGNMFYYLLVEKYMNALETEA